MGDDWHKGAMMNIAGSIFVNLGTNLIRLGLLRVRKRRARRAAQVAASASSASAAARGGNDENAMAASILNASNMPTTSTTVSARAKRAREWRCFLDAWIVDPWSCSCRFHRERFAKTLPMGYAVFLAGNVLNFWSFSYAAQSLLASLGCVQFITNVVFARVVLRETLSFRILGGTMVLIVGVILVVLFSCHGNPAEEYSLNELIALFVRPAYLEYLASLFVAWLVSQCLLYYLAALDARVANGHASTAMDSNLNSSITARGGTAVTTRRQQLEGISFAVASAAVGSQAVTLFKILSELFSIISNVAPNDDVTARAVFHAPFSYAVLFGAVFASLYWVRRLNTALELYDTLFIVPVFQVMWVSMSVVGGGIFFREFEQCMQGTTAIFFILGLIVIFFGVFLLSPQPPPSPSAPPSSSISPVAVLASGDHESPSLMTRRFPLTTSSSQQRRPFQEESTLPLLSRHVRNEEALSLLSSGGGLSVPVLASRPQSHSDAAVVVPTPPPLPSTTTTTTTTPASEDDDAHNVQCTTTDDNDSADDDDDDELVLRGHDLIAGPGMIPILDAHHTQVLSRRTSGSGTDIEAPHPPHPSRLSRGSSSLPESASSS